MSDLASTLGPRPERPRHRTSLGALAILAPLAVAVIIAAPRVWKNVRSEPSATTAVASLPEQQPAAATQLPLEHPPQPQRGQLASLARFVARDPFASPLPTVDAAVTPTVAAGPGGAAPATAVSPDTAAPATAVSPDGAAPATALGPDSAPPTTALIASVATIEVNGIPETVSLKALFPAADPLFRLVALGAGEVQIGVVGGPSAGGEQTVTLLRDRTLTLLDTASGARYELRLVSLP